MATNNSWNQQIAAADTAITLNSGTNAVGISTDASATTVQIANGAGDKTVTLGSTNTTSSLALQCGTNNFSLASASGNIVTAKAAGQLNYPLQPLFSALVSSTSNNVTGDGTVYQIVFNNAILNVGSSYNTSTGVFTVPVAGNYLIAFNVNMYQLSAVNVYQQSYITVNGANSQAVVDTYFSANPFYEHCQTGTVVLPLAAGNTVAINTQVTSGSKVVGIVSGSSFTGYLLS